MTVDESFAALRESVATEIARGREEGLLEGRRSAARNLNQLVRRLRKAASEADVVSLLADAHHLLKLTVCLVLDGDRVTVAGERRDPETEFDFSASDSPALLAVLESRDPVVAAATAGELSEPLFTHAVPAGLSDGKAHLIPIVVHEAVPMVLFAVGDVDTASLEILSETAGLRLESLAVQTKAQPSITEAQPEPSRWTDLNPAERTLHMRAQHFAQVAVARMRVEQRFAVRDGQNRGDLYSALRPEIDAARHEYRAQFLTGQSTTMVDYLYLELLRSLANNEDRLLGAGFPGRLI